MQAEKLSNLAQFFSNACNAVVPFVVESRCWNRVGLHHLTYYSVREKFPTLGSQMVCNAIKRVADGYKVLSASKKIAKDKPVKTLLFKPKSVHFDKRTYSIKNGKISLFTLEGRERVLFVCGEHQARLLTIGNPKEAELIVRHGKWFFNLVLDIPDVVAQTDGGVLGVDVGENNMAATSSGQIFGGEKLRHNRDMYLVQRGRLQSNGSKAAMKKLCMVSGCERRHVTHVNHEVSKQIIQEALKQGATSIAMENLTHIRKNIKAGKRIRSRLHRWSFRQLQSFVAYKARACGISVVFVDPAYTSQTCCVCKCLGTRKKHMFFCSCGAKRHADVNAAANIAWLASSIGFARAAVNQPDFAHQGYFFGVAKSSAL